MGSPVCFACGAFRGMLRREKEICKKIERVRNFPCGLWLEEMQG